LSGSIIQNPAILASCLFAICGLLVPSGYDAEGMGVSVKSIKQPSAQSGDCAGKLVVGQHADSCKSSSSSSDTKPGKMDPDRKGHKVSKSKSRRR